MCGCIHVHVYTCVHTWAFVCVYVCMRVHVCEHMCLTGTLIQTLAYFQHRLYYWATPSHQLFTHPNGGLPNANAFQTRSGSDISCPVLPSSPLFLHLKRMTAYSRNHSWLKCRCDVDPSLSPKPSLVGSELPHLPRFLHCSSLSHSLWYDALRTGLRCDQNYTIVLKLINKMIDIYAVGVMFHCTYTLCVTAFLFLMMRILKIPPTNF